MGDLIQNEQKHRYHSGIQRRWLLNIVSWLVALVGLSVVVTFLTVQSYYYSNLRSGMEAKARTASDFFSNYINLSYNGGSKIVLDRFGHDVTLHRRDEDHFEVSVRVIESVHFLAWVLSLSPEMTIAAPRSVRDRMRELVDSAAAEYGRG